MSLDNGGCERSKCFISLIVWVMHNDEADRDACVIRICLCSMGECKRHTILVDVISSIPCSCVRCVY